MSYYRLDSPVGLIKGVGESLDQQLKAAAIHTVLDLLLYLPLRYEDRSHLQRISEIKQLELKDSSIQKNPKNQQVRENFFTTYARVNKWHEYRKGKLLISRATISDGQAELTCVWFNNRFLKNTIVRGASYFFSGKLKNGVLMQAKVEKQSSDHENIHTARLVPIYASLGQVKQGYLRRLLLETIDHLQVQTDLSQIFRALHFPKQIEQIIVARERLALEEIIYLMQGAKQKQALQQQRSSAYVFKFSRKNKLPQLPFALTLAQKTAVQEILTDLNKNTPMNRLLMGDVGSGKTIVAALPASLLVASGQNVCLLAPTKILAKQHYQNLSQIFGKTKFALVDGTQKYQASQRACFYIGTHALLKHLATIKPALIIYDEQQRFGVKQRQIEELACEKKVYPHFLSMTATPIPRTLMLSIFSHLQVSYLDQMPNARQIATTWLVPPTKEAAALEWLVKELLADPKAQKQALWVCPFINPSTWQATENVAAVKASFEALQNLLEKLYQKLAIPVKRHLKIAVLHSNLDKKTQQQVIKAMYAKEIQLLISTPMIEVGVDLPNADIMLIQSAERFGLSSLHQLRGRVGRQGQKSYCLLFSSLSATAQSKQIQRLQQFCQEKDGLKLAQIDLENRGAGNLLGYEQSGLHLVFASWTNAAILQEAQAKLAQEPNYQSFLSAYLQSKHTSLQMNGNLN